uniref:FAD-binding FR-type domain-containing protein n=1 Tax=Chromera velia CCMP2878 TaxID=1169474 RepID=A0A0G4GXF7_9ALVE|eukprot:Cvel_5342.t1-p1 / transcript=Cvel_5342.t1 / gene=Cvel_5342 / organism=Chromera_velia_CCMP2878 / gene_product=Probable dihydroorotate dehydrogenase B (NAD( )),, putative / transcript_product=Probable dihydroorotate dehydrogenase B (NAD( )),, putative / location=Cvel_scaffold247:97809-99811(-) / protein_length=630 / sequence_SO=supercontig / SO=protein_coding / is_pseudo=false
MSQHVFLGKPVTGLFTIPSGIVSVTLDTVKKLADTVPELGILTTKSIGPEERAGNREPVYAALEDPKGNCKQGAWVGLANPGCREFAKELGEIRPLLPPNKFLLVSIFAGTTEEFAEVARTLGPLADGLELNFSCPHAEGFGQAICAVPDLAAKVVAAVRQVTDKPLLPKLSPNLSDDQIDRLVVSLLREGAAGFSAVNTFGPMENPCEAAGGVNILSKGKGGMSGPVIKDRALEVVGRIHSVLVREGLEDRIPILGMGGIATSDDVRAFAAAGASAFGVGSALTGLSTEEVRLFFSRLGRGESGPGRAPIPPEYMKFRTFTLKDTVLANAQLGVMRFKEPFGVPCQPGQFVEVWVPGEGEKPFAPSRVVPSLELAIRSVGQLTGKLLDLRENDQVFVRGPYGRPFTVPPRSLSCSSDLFVLVGGGTGIAPLLLLAERLSEETGVGRERLHVFLGGRSADQIYYTEEFRVFGSVHLATDDGSEGFHGNVVSCLEGFLRGKGMLNGTGTHSQQNGVNGTHHPQQNGVNGTHHREAEEAPRFRFYNCGPEKMMRAAFDLQTSQRGGSRWVCVESECSIERYMKCGVGICGLCACDGFRTCVDGPIFGQDVLKEMEQFGRMHRAKTSKRLLDW